MLLKLELTASTYWEPYWCVYIGGNSGVSYIYSHLYDTTHSETTNHTLHQSLTGWQTFRFFIVNDHSASPNKNRHYFTFYNSTDHLDTIELTNHGTGSGLTITQATFGKMMTVPPRHFLVGTIFLVCFDDSDTA